MYYSIKKHWKLKKIAGLNFLKISLKVAKYAANSVIQDIFW